MWIIFVESLEGFIRDFKPANAQNFAVICKKFKNDCKMYEATANCRPYVFVIFKRTNGLFIRRLLRDTQRDILRDILRDITIKVRHNYAIIML